MFEVYLKQLYPEQRHINYDISDLFSWIDNMPDIR